MNNNNKSLERLSEEQKSKECFCWEMPRAKMTREENPVHITERVYPDESPSGNECSTSVAYCGEEMSGYSMGGINQVFGRLKEILRKNLPICKKCSDLYLQRLGISRNGNEDRTSDFLPGDDEPYFGSKVYTYGMIRRGEDPYHDGNVDEYGNAIHD